MKWIMVWFQGWGTCWGCWGVKQAERGAEAAASARLSVCGCLSCFCTIGYVSLSHTEAALKKRMWEVWVGVGASSPGRKHSVGRSHLLLVYDSFVLTAIVHESHFISATPWECGVPPPPTSPRAHVCEGSVGGWEGTVIPSLGITCVLGGFHSLAVEAECLNVASGPPSTLSFNYLRRPPPPFGAKLR